MKGMIWFKMVVTAVFGVLPVLIPEWTMSLFGLTLDPAAAFASRIVAAMYILIAVELWFARNDSGSEALRGIFYGVTVGDAIGFVVTLWAQLSGLTNVFGWLLVALFLVLAVGFGYYAFSSPELKPHPAT